MAEFGWLPEAGAASVVIGIVILFLRFLTGERKDRKTERELFVNVITNHLEHSDSTMQDLTLAIKELSLLIGNMR